MLLMLLFLPTLAINGKTDVERINIWSGTDVRHRVWLAPYPARDNSAAVIVCPGGSYFWHDMDAEGEQVGRWLQRHGISAFVLRYRTAYVPAFVLHYRWLLRGNRHPDALNDLRQSLRYVRSHAKQYGVDTTRIGVMGFSAGGHLAMSSVELLPRAEWPSFVVPVYPVVTFVDPCMHKRSRRGLLGDSREHNRRLCDSLSMERHVPDDCPPVFLVNCHDDPIVHYHNAELLDSALTAHHVPHQYIQYRTGGHGFGASEVKGTAECRQWKNAFLAWLRGLWQGDGNRKEGNGNTK
jgi:acetyl esterase/lipase